ncbi:MAG TPA: histidine phosphatase family protein [Mycobacteriales bacterium]|jgi:Fructose-2,6-bisphosphatase
MGAMRVLCLRHGESVDNAAGVLSSGPPGAPLSPAGQAQAERAVPALRRAGVARVYTSPAIRAGQTAQIAATRLGVPVQVLADLTEYGLGEYEGTTDPAARARSATVMRAWIVDGDLDVRLPGGETGRQIAVRFTRAMATIADRHPGQTVAVVSHVGTLSVGLVGLCEGLGADRVWGRILPHAVPFPVDFDGTSWRCPTWPTARPADATAV